MNLLFKRAQTDDATGKVKFKLWAMTELDEDEQHIVKRYRFDSAKLIDVFQPYLLRRSILVGVIFCALALLLLSSFAFPLGIFIAIVGGIAGGYIYYDRQRESVVVRDLIHGRHFACDSVVDLARKEAWLASVVAVLRQVMESAKHWDGTETIPIAALSKEEAKYIAIKGL
ncbi:MAG: hypothetical protein NUV34_05440 [Sulfuricaulis sp.]|nr:hypothetical protein [Sulfuricaulis sp.]